MTRRMMGYAPVGIAAVLMLMLGGAFAANQAPPAVELKASTDSGVPGGFDEQRWLNARGSAQIVERAGGTDTIILTAEGLVPDGIYTVWWVNPRVVGMEMGPGGGLPQNTFTADHEGNAEARLTVDSDNDYQLMVIAYHADHRLHGEEPGAMGETTFEHLKGPWPGPEGRKP